jgi:Family of unknown function (DUF5684)
MTVFLPLAVLRSNPDMTPGRLGMLVWLAAFVLAIAGMWKVYAKAGKSGWASIVPIYHVIVLLEIAGKPLWWTILVFVPFANLVMLIIAWIEVAHRFGRSTGFGWGLALLSPIFAPILGFGDARYQGAPS